MKAANPLRFRCQVGHAFTSDSLAKEQEGRVDEALRVALRIIQETRWTASPHGGRRAK
jgi:two-component system chemotaxis response regulator CheB